MKMVEYIISSMKLISFLSQLFQCGVSAYLIVHFSLLYKSVTNKLRLVFYNRCFVLTNILFFIFF